MLHAQQGALRFAFTRSCEHRSPTAYPALRGRQSDCLQTRLQLFHDDGIDASTNSRLIHGIGQRLDADSIKAISTWLSSLHE